MDLVQDDEGDDESDYLKDLLDNGANTECLQCFIACSLVIIDIVGSFDHGNKLGDGCCKDNKVD